MQEDKAQNRNEFMPTEFLGADWAEGPTTEGETGIPPQAEDVEKTSDNHAENEKDDRSHPLSITSENSVYGQVVALPRTPVSALDLPVESTHQY